MVDSAPTPAAPKLSVIMITGNVCDQSPGAAIFERALRSLAFADELIVVDSASTDSTREIAARFTSHIHVHPYAASLKRQKQIALSYVTGDWVLWVDADEVLPSALAAEILNELRAPRALGYIVVRQHWFAGRPLRHVGDDAVLRLWRRDVGEFAGTENDEHYSVPGETIRFHTPLEHYSSANLGMRMAKIVFFARAHAAHVPLPAPADYGARAAWRYLLRPPLQRFYGVFWVERGYKDGVRGLIWAMLCAISEACVYILVWERAQAASASSSHRASAS